MKNHTTLARRAGALTVLGALGASILTSLPAAAEGEAAAPDLFITEYVEGSSYNKALEIYNPTGAAVDLSDYTLELYANDRIQSQGPTTTARLEGTLGAGETFVVAHAQAGADLLPLADMTSAVTNFNGDDRLLLKNGVEVIDSFGQVDVRPSGTPWAEQTFVRNADICAGDANPDDAFDVAVEWTAYGQNTFEHLGSHDTTCGGAQGGGTFAPDLFFSEYVEGSSYNKALEIYNGTGREVDLSGYSIELYANDRIQSQGPNNTTRLSGSLAAGETFVVVHGSAGADLAPLGDMTGTVTNFNGDDRLLLKNGTEVIDSFGQVDVRPSGTPWAEQTFVRNADICAGDANPDDAFDVAVEWTAYGQNTFEHLRAHDTTCGTTAVDVAPTVTSIVPEDGALEVATSVAPVVTFSEPVVAADGAFSLACDDAPVAVDVAGAEDVYTLTPRAELPQAAACVLTVDAASITDVDGSVAHAMEADVASAFTVTEGVLPIGKVQGETDISPYVGYTVTVEGVVVGDYQGDSLRGIYVQSRDGDHDGNPLTSEGIFVYNPAGPAVALGDLVSVTGVVSEYYGQTQIGSAAVQILSSGHEVTPAQVTLPFASSDAAEALEGMLVEFRQELFVTEIYQLGQYGQVTLSSGDRLQQPTAVYAPGSAEAIALQAANDLNQIIVEDAFTGTNPVPVTLGRGGEPLTAENTLRGGDTVTGMTGVMTYGYSEYRVRPVALDGATPDFQPTNERPTAVPEVGGDVKVASFNVLNYFPTVDTGSGGWICGANQNMECRGADSALELERQESKLVEALVALEADVIGIMEIENTPGVEPLAHLAAMMNDRLGVATWTYVDTGVVGTDAIRVGVLYDAAVVSEAGDHAILDSSVDERFDSSRNRPAVAQSFVETASGETFTVVTNHWKSKGCSGATGPDADQGDGAGCWNANRTAAAEAMIDWLATYPTGVEDDDVLVIGDLNSYAMEAPIQALRDAGYAELGGGYSYVFDGQWGSLDYIFASASMVEQVTGAEHFHINADEPSALDYNIWVDNDYQIDALFAADMYRTSDHDPLLVGLSLGDPLEVVADVTPLGTGMFRAVVTIENVTDEDVADWSVSWTLSGDAQVRTVSRVVWSQEGDMVAVSGRGAALVLSPGEALKLTVVGAREPGAAVEVGDVTVVAAS
ncbi:ExeM/NucH family extracellular endonuclease [Demequina pelophila]|uniref:ExeM/NucH family extracellular endonuclease n=1 Tax=Demequina pelophila TaxID=1638984 RepID=UPI0007830068|nr:ExeM/NucH family extracellular endonuclease [Demequina pelophila]